MGIVSLGIFIVCLGMGLIDAKSLRGIVGLEWFYGVKCMVSNML